MSTFPTVEALIAAVPAGDHLERLVSAIELADSLRAQGDELLDHFVAAARHGGASWSEIGNVLGTSKQAAHQRFSLPRGAPGTEILAAAAEQARPLGHQYIHPEHVILALVAGPDELAGRTLAELGVTPERVSARVEQRLGRAAPRPTGSLGVSPDTKRLLHTAQAVAKALRHRCPRTEHVLLAAVAPGSDGPAAGLLAECGVTGEQIRAQLAAILQLEAPDLAHHIEVSRAGGTTLPRLPRRRGRR